MSWDNSGSQPTWDSQPTVATPSMRMASSQHRIACLVLDTVLLFLTLGFGWLIWSLFTWKEGQSPAKKILKIRVYDAQSHQPVTWGHMAIYELLFGMAVGMICSVINFLTFGLLGSFAYFVMWVTDFCWYWKDGKKRTIRDNIVKVIVVNIA